MAALWLGQFQRFLHSKPPAQVNSDDARRFLTHLAVDRRVVATTRNQAFNALLFLCRHILNADCDLRDTACQARPGRHRARG